MPFNVEELLDGSIDDVRNRLKEVAAGTSEEILQRVTEIVADRDRAEVVRAEAAIALGRCSTDACRARLNHFLTHDDPVIRRLAVTGLGADTADETIEWLISMLTDSVNKVRNDAERSLMKREQQLARVGIESLLRTLNHSVALTRSPAARLLGLTQDPRALQPLLQMFESEDWLERMWAAKSLGDLGNLNAVPTLADHLKHDEKNRVRAASAEALARLRPEGVLELLQECNENDSDEGVKKAAHEGILSLGFEAEEIEDDPFAED